MSLVDVTNMGEGDWAKGRRRKSERAWSTWAPRAHRYPRLRPGSQQRKRDTEHLGTIHEEKELQKRRQLTSSPPFKRIRRITRRELTNHRRDIGARPWEALEDGWDVLCDAVAGSVEAVHATRAVPRQAVWVYNILTYELFMVAS